MRRKSARKKKPHVTGEIEMIRMPQIPGAKHQRRVRPRRRNLISPKQ
jgi:hypothetical protein